MFVVVFFLCKNAPLIVKKAWKEKTPFDDNEGWIIWIIIIFVKLLTVLIFILKEIEVIYYLAYGIFAIIGTIKHPFFFAFHLTSILIRYPTLKNVIRSVYEPRV
jgi:inositol 1,4,5-triphosphate receptor type 1/inositol 1,4,5-triphosphate receptor type 3